MTWSSSVEYLDDVLAELGDAAEEGRVPAEIVERMRGRVVGLLKEVRRQSG